MVAARRGPPGPPALVGRLATATESATSAACARTWTTSPTSPSPRLVDAGPGVLAWLRKRDGERLPAAIDVASEPRVLPVDAAATLLVSTDPDRTSVSGGELELRPDEAVLLRLTADRPARPRPFVRVVPPASITPVTLEPGMTVVVHPWTAAGPDARGRSATG